MSTADGHRTRRWRVLVHALDRTGPPMLARSLVRWLHVEHPDVDVEVLAFRGGALLADLTGLAHVRVVLDDEEPWSPERATTRRGAELRAVLEDCAPVELNLLVSVAAGQVLPLLPTEIGPVVTWSVEIAEDLHWLDDGVGLRRRTSRWLAGSRATATELARRLGGELPAIAPELIEAPDPVTPGAVSAVRERVGVDASEILVLGAGIGTHRKGIDLFVEAAAAHRRQGLGPARYVWVGGERDELHPRARADVRRLGLDHVELVGSVPDLDPWCAAADVFLHTARRDAFPLVCLHAAAVGTPVVAFAGRSGVEEMFREDAVGVAYPDLEALVDTVDRLRDEGARGELGRRQQRHVAARHLAPVALPRLYALAVEAATGAR